MRRVARKGTPGSPRVVILSDAPGVHEERFAGALRRHGATVSVAGGPDFGPFDLAGIIAEARPDVVQVGPLPFAARLAGALPDLRVVLVSYGWDVLAAQRDGWDDMVGAARRADAAICDCAVIEDALREKCLPGTPIARFPWGVDLDLFEPHGPRRNLRAEFEWPDSDILLLATRRLEPLYDPLTLVDAAARSALAARLRLVFVGEGSLSAEVVRRAHDRGFGERVLVLPPVPEGEVASLMRAADIWVNAAHADGASISLLQALACGTPVVTPDLECAREWADASVGALFAVGDADSAAAAVDEVAVRAHEIRAACRRRAEERADWRVHARTYASLVFGRRAA